MRQDEQKLYDFLKAKGGTALELDCRVYLQLPEDDFYKLVANMIRRGYVSRDTLYVQPTISII